MRKPTVLTASALLLCVSSLSLAHGPASKGPEATVNSAINSAIDRAIQFPDTADYQTLVVDLHTHSVFSDGHVWPRTRVEEASRDGLDGLAITEHLEWQPHRADILHPDRNRAYDIARESAKEHDLIVIPGSEITRSAPAGHINAVFVTDANKLLSADDGPIDVREFYQQASAWPAQNAVQAANDQGAFVFWNHPFWGRDVTDGRAKIPKFHRDNAKQNLLHGIEIANTNTYSEEAFAIALKHDLTLIGVSDVHNLIDWDYEPHNGGHRPVTLVFAKERTAEAMKEALFDKRTVVWFKNLLFGRKDQLMPLLEASIKVVDASYRPDTEVLKVRIQNHSDARFLLQNQSRYTFTETNDFVVLPANETTTLHIKPGKRMDKVEIKFSVVNAWTAPGKVAALKLEFIAKPE